MHSYDLTQWVLFFFIYSFIGWVWESCYVSLRKRRWVNRGFMHGPMLPLYGSGALVVLVSTIGVRDNVVLIFVLGMSAATILEYFTGAVMESLLTSSLCWGCFSVLLVRVVHLPIEAAVLRLPSAAATWISMILAVTAAVDLTQSFNEAMDMRRLLAQLEESKKQIRKMQDKLRVTTEEVREDYRKYLQERSEKKHTRRKAYLERINMKRIETQDLLSDLYERTDQLLREELPSKVNSLIGEERRADLLTLKQNIKEELRKMSSRTDRGYLRVAEHLRRNPTAVSERFKEALEEIRRIMGG